ncbi:MAG: cation:proton antiporter [Cyanobacteriota bacterium]
MVTGHAAGEAANLLVAGRFLLIFVTARLLAEAMVRLRLPTILGELLAGVALGVSGLRLVVPPDSGVPLAPWLVAQLGRLSDLAPDQVLAVADESFPALQVVASLGLYALLFVTGLESDLDELIAVGGQAVTVACAGVVLPFLLGTAGLMLLFHVDPVPAVFAGASMTATSIGITASVFAELGMLRRREGLIVIGAAVLDDILGIVILAVVVAFAGGGSLTPGPILQLVAAALVFVLAAVALSRRIGPAFDRLIDILQAPGELVVASFVVLFVACFTATAIGLEAALGAFAAGLILSNSSRREAIRDAVAPVVSLFATVFFVLIGTAMDLSVLDPTDPANRSGLLVALFLLVAAIVGKLASGWSFVSREPTNRLLVGVGMLPRGEVGLIFLGLGTAAGLLSPALEAAILLMVIGTTFLAPLLLRLLAGPQTAGTAEAGAPS